MYYEYTSKRIEYHHKHFYARDNWLLLGTAANVSRDSELRREIYKGIEVNSDILKKMGMAEMQREMERRILPLVDKIKLSHEMRNRMDSSEEDVKIMINEVLTEIHSKRSRVRPSDNAKA